MYSTEVSEKAGSFYRVKRISILASVICLLAIVLPVMLSAQCALANPSFEITGSNGLFFAGWNQFGNVGSSSAAYHGSLAAKLSGQNNGSQNASGYWQQLDCEVGEQWEISGHVFIAANAPLGSTSEALIKVEWYNASGGLIDYDSITIADAASPPGEYIAFALLSTQAPAGTVAMRLVACVIQNPGDAVPELNFDQITCYSTTSPTIDDVQWVDFPDGRILEFSGRTYRVKGSGWYGPGPNNFSHLPQSVWVDSQDRLHLTIKQYSSAWYSTEVTLEEALGYGDYIFTTVGSLNLLDIRTVLGLFIWQYNPCWDSAMAWWNPYNEIDIEYSRWGNPANQIGQYVAQPWDWAGNIDRYDAVFQTDELSSHAFKWLGDRVEFRSWRGGPEAESPQNMIHTWTYTGPHIPRPEQARVHMNLWYFGNPPVADQEVIISQFTYNPASGGTESVDQVSVPAALELRQNYPNPFNPSTVINYNLLRAGMVTLNVYDLKGRRVATLVDSAKEAGQYSLVWDAADLASGIYFYRLSSGGESQTRKMILLK